MKPLFDHPVRLRGLAFLGLLLLALAILGGMIWRNLQRFEAVLSYANYSHRIQNVSVGLQHSLIEYLTETKPAALSTALTGILQEMDELMAGSRDLSNNTRKSLTTVRDLLIDVSQLDEMETNTRLLSALKVMSETLENESRQREMLLEDISRATEAELYLALIVLTLILIAAVIFLKSRILQPLKDLKRLLQQLTEENFTPIRTDHLDPLLLPVFNSYNEMVGHLSELEAAKREYARSLQQEVRLATQALLEQQTSLARAERLAAIGEVAAELAHEIRNPLAGIQMAFSNLRREIVDSGQCERMELISNELKRLARLFNDVLDQSRHSPEASTDMDLSPLIRDLLALTRYQIAENIAIEVDVPASLPAHLPESGLRQALLNLVLNSAEALEGKSGTISIRARRNELGVLIDVLDDGPGFSQELLEQGIRPFRTSRSRGTGLGLAMVQRFVKDIGGAIKLANQESRGACVTLTLPSNSSPADNRQ
ncbi:MAG: sensor histidine kinase [Gammaproteobacteria bacterium]